MRRHLVSNKEKTTDIFIFIFHKCHHKVITFENKKTKTESERPLYCNTIFFGCLKYKTEIKN